MLDETRTEKGLLAPVAVPLRPYLIIVSWETVRRVKE